MSNLFIPTEIMMIITEYLGYNYWKHRNDLSIVSLALDFQTSNYALNTYWDWNEWRLKNYTSGVKLNKPQLPERFCYPKIRRKTLENNKYILSIDPPYMGTSYHFLNNLHKKLRKKVYF